jgi:hypothetical protein
MAAPFLHEMWRAAVPYEGCCGGLILRGEHGCCDFA